MPSASRSSPCSRSDPRRSPTWRRSAATWPAPRPTSPWGWQGSALEPADIDAAADAFTGARWLHLTGITPALSASAHGAVLRAIELARASGVRISFDVNLRRRLWSDADAATRLGPIAIRADLVFGDADELAVVAGVAPSPDGLEAARALRSAGAGSVVVKRGAAGATLVGDGSRWMRPRSSSRGWSTRSGPGSVLCRLPRRAAGGPDASMALAWGNGCAAAVMSVEGDLTGLPTRAESEHLIGGTATAMIR